MKVILLKDIKGTGKKDQILEVSDGYGRNFLLPRKMAIEATSEALNSIEKSKQAAKHREDVKRDEAEQTARALKGKVVIVKVRAGEAGRLYGSITTQEIADALKAQHGIELDKRKIDLDEKVTSVGQTSMTLKLSAGVPTKMRGSLYGQVHRQRQGRGKTAEEVTAAEAALWTGERLSPATATPCRISLESADAASGREIRKETIPCPAGKLASPGIAPRPPHMSPGPIENEGTAAPSNYPGVRSYGR